VRLTATLCLALFIPLAAGAQERGLPRLGDHDFVPVLTIDEPFITTHVQTSVSLGKAVNTLVPVLDVTDSTIIGTANADILVAALSFRYQQEVKDWLAFKFDLLAGGRLGTSSHTLVSEGFTGGVGYNLAWLLGIHRSRTFELSGSLGLGNYSATFVNLRDWASGIIEGIDIPLSRARNSLRGSGGLHAAWGISRRFGLLGTLIMSYGESFDGFGENQWTSDSRLALSYDAAHDLNVPLGVALTGGRFERNEGYDSGTEVWFWSVRLAHQGRDDFTIGIDLQHTYGEANSDVGNLELNVISIDMRYYY
jgi:hypothetical protein